MTKAPNDWYGIRAANGSMTLANCVVEYAGDGIRFEDTDTRWDSYSISDLTIRRCSGNGIWTTSGQYAQPITLNNIHLMFNSVGLTANGPVTLTGGQVANNTGIGISGSAAMTLTGCAITGNGGVGVSGSGAATLAGCAITGNGGDGVWMNASLQINGCTVSRNVGWGVNVYDYCNGSAMPAEIWNSSVLSNGSGGLTFNYAAVVGLVNNTISRNSGIGVNLNQYSGYIFTGVTYTAESAPLGS